MKVFRDALMSYIRKSHVRKSYVLFQITFIALAKKVPTKGKETQTHCG